MKNFHLIPDGDRWKLTEEDSERSLFDFATKAEAVQRSTEFMKQRSGSLKIHLADGTIEEERTYPRAADPVTTPG